MLKGDMKTAFPWIKISIDFFWILRIFLIKSKGNSVAVFFIGYDVKLNNEVVGKRDLLGVAVNCILTVHMKPIAGSDAHFFHLATPIGSPQCRKIAYGILAEIFEKEDFITRHKVVCSN